MRKKNNKRWRTEKKERKAHTMRENNGKDSKESPVESNRFIRNIIMLDGRRAREMIDHVAHPIAERDA